MSQSLLYHAFGVREGYEYVCTKYPQGGIEFTLAVKEELLVCPACRGEEVVRKGKRYRHLQTVPIGFKPVVLKTEVPQCECKACGKTFEVTPSFAQPYVRYAQRLSQLVYDLSQVMTLADVADAVGLSWDTVKDMVTPFLQKTIDHLSYRDLKHLAIDEIYVGRKRKFYTLAIDLDTGRIVWVAHGRGGDCLRKFWRRLRLAKAKIVAVAMDMSAAYWKAVRDNLREAAIVFDKFHIVKLVQEKLDELRRALVRQAEKIVKSPIKGLRYLLLTRREHLPADKLQRLDEALQFNQPLFTAYDLKEELTLLWEQPTLQAMEVFLQDWCHRAAQTGIRLFQSLAKTLLGHRSGILSWFTHRINSGRMEGINNKIRTLTRSAYGYRDEGFFFLKLYNLHRSRQELVG
jgi:transposase